MKTLHGHLTGFCHGPNSSGLVLHVTYSDVKTVGHFLGQGVQSIFHSNFIGTMEFHGSLYPFSLKLRIKAEYLFPVTFWSCLAIYKQKGFPSRRPTKQNFSTFFGGGNLPLKLCLNVTCIQHRKGRMFALCYCSKPIANP